MFKTSTTVPRGSAPGLESMAPHLVIGMGDNNIIDELWYWYRVLSLMQTKQLIHSKRKGRLRNSLRERSRYLLILCRWIIRVSLVSAVGTNILVSFHRGQIIESLVRLALFVPQNRNGLCLTHRGRDKMASFLQPTMHTQFRKWKAM